MFKFHFSITLPNSNRLSEWPFPSGIQNSVKDSLLSHACHTVNPSCHYSLIILVFDKHYKSRTSTLYTHFLPFPLSSVHTSSWSLWSQTYSAYNYQKAIPFIISLVLLHERNTTMSVSFWNFSIFCVPAVEDKASLPSLHNTRPDLNLICTNPVHIFTTNMLAYYAWPETSSVKVAREKRKNCVQRNPYAQPGDR